MSIVKIKVTKNSTFGVQNEQFLLYHPGEGFKPMTEEEKSQKTAYLEPYGWEEYEAQSCNDALKFRNAARKKAQTERKARKEGAEQEDIRKIEKLLKLEVIPSTLENIRLVMKHLSGQNWGSWTLPKMEIGYRAHQYDCDGRIAVTFQLSKPVGGQTSFSYNAPRGHLVNYENIEMFV